MAKKTLVETKKQDVLFSGLQQLAFWVRDNARTAIIAGVVIVCLVLGGWGLALYQANRSEKAQYALFQAVRSFEEYSYTGKGDGLTKAEDSFKKLVKDSPGGVKDLSRLYLARIATMKGKNDEARALYAEVSKNPANDVVKTLSDEAAKGLPKK